MSQLSGSADNVPFHGVFRCSPPACSGRHRRRDWPPLCPTDTYDALDCRPVYAFWMAISGAWQFATQRTCQRKTDQPELILPGEIDAPRGDYLLRSRRHNEKAPGEPLCYGGNPPVRPNLPGFLILPRNSQKNACGRISGSASFIPAINQTQRRKPGCANIARHSGRLLSSSRNPKGICRKGRGGAGSWFPY